VEVVPTDGARHLAATSPPTFNYTRGHSGWGKDLAKNCDNGIEQAPATGGSPKPEQANRELFILAG
jgi:hypothetical protein